MDYSILFTPIKIGKCEIKTVMLCAQWGQAVSVTRMAATMIKALNIM